jgi:hypothetical protein
MGVMMKRSEAVKIILKSFKILDDGCVGYFKEELEDEADYLLSHLEYLGIEPPEYEYQGEHPAIKGVTITQRRRGWEPE